MALELALVVALWCAVLALGGYFEERLRGKDDGEHVVHGRPRW